MITLYFSKGQDCKAKDVVEDLSSPNKVEVLENLSHTSNTNQAFSSNDCNSSPLTTANSSMEKEVSNDLACNDEYDESHSENNENVGKVEEDTSLKSEVTASEYHFSSSNIGSDVTCKDYTREATEISKTFSADNPENSLDCQSGVIDKMIDESSLSPEVLPGDTYMINSTADEYLDMHDHDVRPLLLTNEFLPKKYCSHEQVEKIDNNGDDVFLSSEMTIMDAQSRDLNIDRAIEREESSHKLIKYFEELSLAEKVTRFIQNGDLDMIDGTFRQLSSSRVSSYFIYGCCTHFANVVCN